MTEFERQVAEALRDPLEAMLENQRPLAELSNTEIAAGLLHGFADYDVPGPISSYMVAGVSGLAPRVAAAIEAAAHSSWNQAIKTRGCVSEDVVDQAWHTASLFALRRER